MTLCVRTILKEDSASSMQTIVRCTQTQSELTFAFYAKIRLRLLARSGSRNHAVKWCSQLVVNWLICCWLTASFELMQNGWSSHGRINRRRTDWWPSLLAKDDCADLNRKNEFHLCSSPMVLAFWFEVVWLSLARHKICFDAQQISADSLLIGKLIVANCYVCSLAIVCAIRSRLSASVCVTCEF